ncbi:MAG: hypothetical protein ABMA64_13050 [Myxococcota bacterium]
MEIALAGYVWFAPGQPAGGAWVVVTDEGRPVAAAHAGADGAFLIPGLPASGAVTVRAIDSTFGTGAAVVPLPPAGPVELTLGNGECQLFYDLPDPRWLVTEEMLGSWGVEPLEPVCPGCPTYRWFWDRPGLTPVLARLDYTPDGVISTVRYRAEDGWVERVAVLPPRRAARLDAAFWSSGFWQLEHASTPCEQGGSEWTIEATATPGYRAVYRTDPVGTPIAYLGRRWVKVVRLRVRRRDLR